jgi:hypothetical protein
MERKMHFSGLTIGPRALRRAAIFLGLGGALLAASGCNSTKDMASYPCPAVLPVRDASYMTKFDGASQDLSDTLYEAKIDSVLPAANCIYQLRDDGNTIVYDIRLQFLAQRGPKEREGSAKFDYFVAVTGAGGKPLAREVFPAEIPFENGATQAIIVEEIQPTIPLKAGENGDFYRIYVGFILSEQEMAYNRKNPR